MSSFYNPEGNLWALTRTSVTEALILCSVYFRLKSLMYVRVWEDLLCVCVRRYMKYIQLLQHTWLQ